MPFRHDIRTVTVPGCVDGWVALHARFGRLALDVLAPAIGYAGTASRPRHARGSSRCSRRGAERRSCAARPAGDAWRGAPAAGRRPCAGCDRLGRAGGFYEGAFGEGLLTLGAGEYTGTTSERRSRWVDPIASGVGPHPVDHPAELAGLPPLLGAWIAEGLPLPDDPDDPLGRTC